MIRIVILTIAVSLLTASVNEARAADGAARVVIYDGVVTKVTAQEGKTSDLWITLSDLTRATKFVLKPEGVCNDKLCFPIPKDRKKDFLDDQSFNLSEFARLLKQPVAHDARHDIWCFGPRPEVQNAHVRTAVAPDFTLPDLQGKLHALSDFRGKKVLLITWASW